jgi:hypothetical protein
MNPKMHDVATPNRVPQRRSFVKSGEPSVPFGPKSPAPIPTILVHRSELAGMWSATFADGPRGLTWVGGAFSSIMRTLAEARLRWPHVQRVRIIDQLILTPSLPGPVWKGEHDDVQAGDLDRATHDGGGAP